MLNTVWKRFKDLTDELTTTYAQPQYLEIMLRQYLQPSSKNRGGYPLFTCNLKNHGEPSVSINRHGKIGCGCFKCHVFCKNPIDVAQSFGNIYDFHEQVLEAAEILGLISSSEAIELRNGDCSEPKKTYKRPTPPPAPPVTTYEKKSFDVDKADKIYRLFSNLNQYNGQSRLNETDMQDLRDVRKLSKEEISKIGFFSFPNCSIEPLLAEMKKYNLQEDDLKYIPGFFFDKSKKKWNYAKLKNNGTGYGIPIRNENGKITGIQIRLSGENVETRYFWFSSNFAMNLPDTENNLTYGNSPGTPFSIVFPKERRKKTVFITEGFYKAYAFANTYGCIAISVQGVNNIDGIEKLIDTLHEKYVVSNIIIGFDADMAVNPNVLKPAFRIGSKFCEEMPKELAQSFDKILANGFKDENSVVRNFAKEAKELKEFFKTSYKFPIYYCVWNMELEKGVDDLILANHQSNLQYVKMDEFWSKGFCILKEIDNYKLDNMSETTKFTDVDIPKTISLNLFKNIVLAS